MPLYYSFYTDLEPGLYRRLSYGEYTRRRYRRYRYRHLISRNDTMIPISIPDPVLYRSTSPVLYRSTSPVLYRSTSDTTSTFTQTFGLDLDLYSSEDNEESRGSRLSSDLSRPLFGSVQDRATGSTFENVLSKTKVKINKDNDQFCPICQDDVKIDSDIVRELECNHIYHIECIDNWLIIKNECPMCKNKI